MTIFEVICIAVVGEDLKAVENTEEGNLERKEQGRVHCSIGEGGAVGKQKAEKSL